MKKYFALFKQTASEFSSDKVPRLGAALAYYTVFSLAPLLLIAIAIAGVVFGEEAARNQVFAQLEGVLGPLAAKAVQEMVENAAKPASGALATIIGIVTLIFGASGVFGQLKEALNTIWDVKPKKTGGIFGFIKQRFLSAAMVLVMGFLLLVSLVIDAAIAAIVPHGAVVWEVLQLTVLLGVVTVLFAAIFRFLPDLKIEWRDVWLGAFLTALMFVIGKFALGLYLGKSAVASTYGAAGSLVVLLLWVYYSAQILLFGAEFTQVYTNSKGGSSLDVGRSSRQEARLPDQRPTKNDQRSPLGAIAAAIIAVVLAKRRILG